MDFAWFIDLGHLARTGNFSRAAELCNISQPAFSRRIKGIETWVGAELVDRSRQPVHLTPAGLQMLEAGQQALARLEAERQQIRDAQSAPDRYVVTFGAQHSIGWRFYPDWMQAFERSFGPIIARLRADDLFNCVRDLEAREIDFVIAYASPQANPIPEQPGLESLLIGRDVLMPVCGRGSDGKPLFDLDAASGPLPLLWFGNGAPIGDHLAQLLRTPALRDKLKVSYENAMSGALRIRARDGAGIAWLPRSLVTPDLEAGLLVRTGAPALDVDLEIRLYRLRGQTNRHTRSIWAYLAIREPVPLIRAL